MTYDLALRPTVINGNKYRDDYIVVWRSDFGERRVGRIRLTEGSVLPMLAYHLQADIAVPPSCDGRAAPLTPTQSRRFNAAAKSFITAMAARQTGDMARNCCDAIYTALRPIRPRWVKPKPWPYFSP